jgi:hypothetical protein
MRVVRFSALRTGRLYPQGNIPSTLFCWWLSRPQGHSAEGRFMSMKNSLTPSEIEPATFRLVTRASTNCAITCLVVSMDEWNVSTEHWWNNTDWGKPKYSQTNLSQCHCSHNKYHIYCSVIASIFPRWETVCLPEICLTFKNRASYI